MIFLFATFDDASQLAVGKLIDVRKKHPELRILGVALQPNPQPFLDSYAGALAIDFPLAYEPAGTILRGESGLGEGVTVPSFFAVDSGGRVVQTFAGVPTLADLEGLIAPLADSAAR